MKKICIILTILITLNANIGFVSAAGQKVDPKQTIKTNYPKMQQNFNNMSTDDKSQADELLEKAVSMLPAAEETELRNLIQKASSDIDSLSSQDFDRLTTLQMKALKLLPKEEYEKIMSLSSKVVQ
jgi:hypothetical protein